MKHGEAPELVLFKANNRAFKETATYNGFFNVKINPANLKWFSLPSFLSKKQESAETLDIIVFSSLDSLKSLSGTPFAPHGSVYVKARDTCIR